MHKLSQKKEGRKCKNIYIGDRLKLKWSHREKRIEMNKGENCAATYREVMELEGESEESESVWLKRLRVEKTLEIVIVYLLRSVWLFLQFHIAERREEMKRTSGRRTQERRDLGTKIIHRPSLSLKLNRKVKVKAQS